MGPRNQMASVEDGRCSKVNPATKKKLDEEHSRNTHTHTHTHTLAIYYVVMG